MPKDKMQSTKGTANMPKKTRGRKKKTTPIPTQPIKTHQDDNVHYYGNKSDRGYLVNDGQNPYYLNMDDVGYGDIHNGSIGYHHPNYLNHSTMNPYVSHPHPHPHHPSHPQSHFIRANNYPQYDEDLSKENPYVHQYLETSPDEEFIDEAPMPERTARARPCGRQKIDMTFITKKTKRNVTFSKRKKGLMKKAYELHVLTGSSLLLLLANENGHVYTYSTPKFKPFLDSKKGIIRSCLFENTAGNARAKQGDEQYLADGSSIETSEE